MWGAVDCGAGADDEEVAGAAPVVGAVVVLPSLWSINGPPFLALSLKLLRRPTSEEPVAGVSEVVFGALLDSAGLLGCASGGLREDAGPKPEAAKAANIPDSPPVDINPVILGRR